MKSLVYKISLGSYSTRCCSFQGKIQTTFECLRIVNVPWSENVWTAVHSRVGILMISFNMCCISFLILFLCLRTFLFFSYLCHFLFWYFMSKNWNMWNEISKRLDSKQPHFFIVPYHFWNDFPTKIFIRFRQDIPYIPSKFDLPSWETFIV